jgi:hypothetical protein
MSTADGHRGVMGAKFPQEREGEGLRGGPRGNYPCLLIQTHFLKLSLCIKPSNFLLSVSKPQSLNTCKRVGVKSHFT